MPGPDQERSETGGRTGRVEVLPTLVSALGGAGALWRLFLAFALWFATAGVPWVNLGTTLGLVAAARDLARGRPVSPIEIFDASHRAKILPALGTFGLGAAAVAGVALAGAAAAFHAGLFFAAFPGWTVRGAALPCPCLAATPWQRFAALAVTVCGAVPAMVLAAAWAFALPVFLDTGKTGAEALRASRELVGENLVPVLALLLVPAVLAAAAPLAALACGGSVFAAFVAETVAAVPGLAVYGRTYGALLETRASGDAGKEARVRPL